MNSPHGIEDWELPESEILDYTYKLIDEFGFDNVRTMTERALETSLNHGEAMMLVYRRDILSEHLAILDRVTAWKSEISVAHSHAPLVHPFDSKRRLLAILNDTPYIPPDVPDNAPTLDPAEHKRWIIDTLLGEQRHNDKQASRERNVRWHQMRHDPCHEPEDWEDFLGRKREDEAQHHRAGRDELNDHIYNNTAPFSPSGLTTTMSSRPNPPQLHYWHWMRVVPPPMLRPRYLALPAGYHGPFDPQLMDFP